MSDTMNEMRELAGLEPLEDSPAKPVEEGRNFREALNVRASIRKGEDELGLNEFPADIPSEDHIMDTGDKFLKKMKKFLAIQEKIRKAKDEYKKLSGW